MRLPDPLTIRQYLSETVSSVFATMMGLETSLEETGQFNPPDAEVTATVSFTGEINGVVCLTFQEKYAQLLTSQILCMPVEEISGHEEVNDAIGEIANMVAGNFKSKLISAKTPAVLSLPSIYRGKLMKIESINDASKFEFLFRQESHFFLIDVFLQANIPSITE